ncbi:hypothetical protein AOLI_G00295460 [Acnodon oligacanthus]
MPRLGKTQTLYSVQWTRGNEAHEKVSFGFHHDIITPAAGNPSHKKWETVARWTLGVGVHVSHRLMFIQLVHND